MSYEKKEVLFTLINEALRLDTVGNSKEAYHKYLDGMRLLCAHLIDEEKKSGIPAADEPKKSAKQIFFVVRKCLDRLEVLVDENDTGLKLTQTKDCNARPPATHFKENLHNEPTKSSTRHNLPSEVSRPNGIQGIANGHRPIIYVPSVKSRHRMSVMEQAQRENALLYYAYEKRIAQPMDRSNRISLQLELQRRMTENLALAKAKDAVYRQEEMKKEKKALERAARKLFRKGKNAQSECETTSDKKDWEKQWLYAQMLQYEDHEPWPGNLRKRLKEDPEMTIQAIQNTLSTPEYPLVDWMLHAISNIQHKIQTILDKHSDCMRLIAPNPVVDFQAMLSKSDEPAKSSSFTTPGTTDGNVLSMFDPLLPAVEDSTAGQLSNVEILHYELLENSLRRQLDNIIVDIVNLTDTLGQLISLNYEISNNFYDLCYQTVEEHVYGFLWWKLQVIFRMCNEEAEKQISRSIKQLQNQTPEQMSVPYYFSELPRDVFQEILSHLQSITQLHTPISKLKTLVQVVEDINRQPEAQAQLNADDLISIISYLIVQSDLPQLMSECDALDCLVPHMYLMGEEGFVLTTFQTALKYLETQIDSEYSQNKELL